MKRALDLAVSVGGLLLLAPLFLTIAAFIKLDSRGPVFFRQIRMGSGRKTFRIYKFRTMVVDADARKDEVAHLNKHAASGDTRMFKIPEDPRVTRVGRFLRRYSLDELPQLINILRGDMSLVGPRPCLGWETELFQPHQFERFRVPAGLTGMWQVSARSRSTFGEALDMDVSYARGWSLGLDLWLILRTPLHVLRRKGTA